MVAFCVGGDVLDGADGKPRVVVFDEFNAIFVLAEMVVVGGCGGENGGFVGDDADAATLADEEFF